MKLTANDRFDIHELLFEAFRLIEAHDADGWVNCYTEDAVLHITRYGRFEGHAAILGFVTEHLAAGREDGSRHFSTNVAMSAAADRVHVVSRVLKTTTGRPPTLVAAAEWNDAVVKTPEGWKFAERRLENGAPPSD